MNPGKTTIYSYTYLEKPDRDYKSHNDLYVKSLLFPHDTLNQILTCRWNKL